jgi:signal transduction histidine kinase
MSAVYNRVKSGHYYLVRSNGQEITSRSLFDAQFPGTDNSVPQSYYTAGGPGQETWLVWYQQVNKNNHTLDIWIAENIQPFERQLLTYTGYALVLVTLITAILIFLQQRTLHKSFQVFEALRSNLIKIRMQQTEKSGINPPQEIMPLIHEIESLVTQLKNRIERTRHAIGNLAHELKRPIQLLRIQLDEKHCDAKQPLEEIKAIVDRELRRAKISGSQNIAGDFDPAEEVASLIQVMGKIYPHIQVEIAATDSPGSVKLDRDDMLELIGNLLDNSCKYALHRVRVGYQVTNNVLVLTFEDDGPGLDHAQIEQIQQRGVRLDETKEGHGIGLSLVQDIVNSYCGRLSYSAAEAGGLKVEVQIPGAHAQI